MAHPNLYKEIQPLINEAVKREQNKTHYVYLEGPYGIDFIGKGTKEQCEKIKARKMQDWRPGYPWEVNIYDKEIKEYCYWD